MTTPESLFRLSQPHISRAEAARFEEREDDYRAALSQAYALQAECADMLADHVDAEPTRSIVHMSAASLAMRLGLYAESIALCDRGLAGNPIPYAHEHILKVREICEQRSNANNNTAES